jgi:DNA-binding Lrp family transcriptional regulator
MVKSSIKQIEKDEKKILGQLSKNANKSINDIAKTCGFSRQKVWRVINNLEKNHTIWGYVAVLDNEKLNRNNYIMLIKRSNKPITKKLTDDVTSRRISDEVRENGIDITCSFYTHGNYDWVICFSADNIREAKGFVEYFNRLYKGFLSDIQLIEVLFSAVRSGVRNPEVDKLNDFFEI